ncbi:histidine-rich glycoprotein-like [Senna tora]|uniref:Histidine-rich glycoprotein-like n=1 Tax=Senna tora TaxID=362788 RepID=A0A834WP43_9FABA|nr:histidine-rich glycoprotein-like [Senna tora]
MASPTSSFTLFFCLLLFFTLSSARTPLDLPDANHDSLSESDHNSAVPNTIFLPSDKLESESESESESVTDIQSDRQNSDSKTSKPDTEVELEPLESTESAEPITVISFRPVNRHIPRRPLPLSFRLGHRCRHGHEFKPWNPRLPRRQIPYGNDMILSNGEDRSFDLNMPDGGVRQIPVRWTRFRRVDPRFSDETRMERSDVMRRPHFHHHHDHDHDHDHHHFHEHERDHDDDGVMKRIRKFLQHF